MRLSTAARDQARDRVGWWWWKKTGKKHFENLEVFLREECCFEISVDEGMLFYNLKTFYELDLNA